jgi:hypothetical protein
MHDESFATLARRLAGTACEGDEGEREAMEEAWRRLFADYFHRLLRLAQKLLGGVAPYSSPDSAVLSALRSFYVRHGQGGFPELGDAEALWRVLAAVTACKCHDRVRYFSTRMRDVRRRRDLDPSTDAGAEPSHEEQAQLADQLARLLEQFSPRDRRIAALLLKGYNAREIVEGTIARTGKSLPEVDRLGPEESVSQATIERLRRRLAAKLEQSLTDAMSEI